jgi:4-hydroxyphenylpyruvate dioxygenase-like putative hemolysin
LTCKKAIQATLLRDTVDIGNYLKLTVGTAVLYSTDVPAPGRIVCQETQMEFQPWDNPMATDGFEFIEYAAPDPKALGALFMQMGFAAIARHRHKDVTLYRQGEINFIINAEQDSFAQRFARQHGPSICAIALRVDDAAFAYRRALELGA